VCVYVCVCVWYMCMSVWSVGMCVMYGLVIFIT